MLETRHLAYKHILLDINARFEAGKIYGLIGRHGAGKSSLLRILAGIWTPSSGEVIWKENSLLELPRIEISKIITFIPKQYEIHFDFTVREMVEMGRYKKPYNPELITQALSEVGGLHLENDAFTQLSHGERQLVLLARALASQCPVLLLDEPTVGLDFHHQLRLWEILEEQREKGKIVIVSTHDLRSAQVHCDYFYLLEKGKVAGEGGFQDVMQDSILRN